MPFIHIASMASFRVMLPQPCSHLRSRPAQNTVAARFMRSSLNHAYLRRSQTLSGPAPAAAPAVLPEGDIPELTPFLDSLKWDGNGLVVAIAQHADTGEVLMQAFADRAAVSETLQTG